MNRFEKAINVIKKAEYDSIIGEHIKGEQIRNILIEQQKESLEVGFYDVIQGANARQCSIRKSFDVWVNELPTPFWMAVGVAERVGILEKEKSHA